MQPTRDLAAKKAGTISENAMDFPSNIGSTGGEQGLDRLGPVHRLGEASHLR
jgi:hypothetical protein